MARRRVEDDDEDYEDTGRRDSDNYDKRRDGSWWKKMCIGTGLCAIIACILALLCFIIAFSVNELTENEISEAGGDYLACGWNKPIDLDGPDKDYSEWTELCDECSDDSCASCVNKVCFSFCLFIYTLCVIYIYVFIYTVWR